MFVGSANTAMAQFPIKYKEKKTGKEANARLILQGFKHVDVLSGRVDKDAPTLSKLGRHLVYVMAVQNKHRQL